MTNGKYLYEISLIRAVLVVLLVFYHAFIVYNSGWEIVGNIKPNNTYRWLDRLSYSCKLEAFVIISGAIGGFQITRKSTTPTLG